MTTTPSSSSQHQKPTPSGLGLPLWSPRLVGWNVLMPRSASSVLSSVGLKPLSSDCMMATMATSHSHDRPSSSTFAPLSLDFGWTRRSTQVTPFDEEQLLGRCRRASMRTPSSFSAGGIPTAIADTLTVRRLSGAQWSTLPSIRPGKDPSSLLVLLGGTQSSKPLAEPLAPLL